MYQRSLKIKEATSLAPYRMV